MTSSSNTTFRLARAFKYDAGGQLLVQLAMLGTGIVLARTLGPVEFGRLALVMAVASTAALVANLGGTETATRFVAELKARGQLGSLLRVVMPLIGVRMAASVVAGLVVVSFRGPVGNAIGLDGSFSLTLAMLAAAYAALSGLQGPSQVVLVNLDRQRFINLVNASTGVAAFGVLLVLALSNALTVELAVLVTAASLLVRVVLLVTNALRTVYGQHLDSSGDEAVTETNALRRRMARYSITMLLIGVGGFVLQTRSDEYFVGAILGVQAVAFYHLAEGFSRTVFSIPASRLSGLLMTGMLTEGYVRSGAASLQRQFKQMVRFRFSVSVPLGFGGALLAGPLVDAIYGPEYAGAADLLALFFLLQMPLQWIGAISGVLVAVEKPHWFLWTKAVALLTIPLTIWWLHAWGLQGAVLATSLGMAMAAGLEFAAARRYAQISFPLGDVARYLLAGGLMAAPVAVIAGFMPGPSWLTLVVAVPVGALFYAAGLLAFRAFKPDELVAIRQALLPARQDAPQPGR